MRNVSTERYELILRCAWLYHDDHLTQEQIADRLKISRSTVSRALSEAERMGIVRIVITEPLPEALRLETALTERYGVTAVVGVTSLGDDPRSAAGRAAARTLENLVLQDGITVALGWGRTMAAMVPFLQSRKTRRVTIVGAIGHPLESKTKPSATVIQEIGSRFGADVEWVPAPLYSIGLGVTEALVGNLAVARVLDRARGADVIFSSIGKAELANPLVAPGMLTPEAMTEMLDRGAVGDILANFFDAQGNEVTLDDFEPVGLRLEDVRDAARVVAVATGTDRVPAVRAALLAGLVSELITDQETAEALLDGP